VTRPRLIFVNRFFHPDHSATAQLLTDLCLFLAEEGWEVHVVTSRSLYDDPSARLSPTEEVGGVHVHRLRTTAFGRGHVAGRAADYLSFYPAAFAPMLKLARRGDIVIAKTDPPLLSVVCALAARARGARLVNWLQDLYPEVAGELGMAVLKGPIGAPLRALRNRSLRRAAVNVAIGERMAGRLPGAPAVIHNWTDDEAITPLPFGHSPLRAAWGIAPGDFVVGYSGNLGRAHEVETVLAAARTLRERPDVKFLFIGGGHHSGPLGTRVAAEGLTNVLFQPYQPRDKLAQSLAAPDVHWVSLRPALEGLIVPSKFYGAAAAGRPVIAVTDADGELARLVRAHGCGVVIEPGDGAGMARAITQLAADRQACARMGGQARAMIEARFSRALALQVWAALLDDVAGR
jgi:colanic acid biosynthesis glycosyl transferase WcaI